MTYIDSAIACIVAREFLEATMFITSHFGAVSKNNKLDHEMKMEYYKSLVTAIAAALFGGLAVSLGVGFGLKEAFESDQGLEAEVGMETGEAVSKFIGAVFVTKMMFKMPKWFGITNFERIENEEYQSPNTLKKQDIDSLLDDKKGMAFNLFWNLFREMSETGCFVAIEGFLSTKAFHTLGWSVCVGLAASVCTFLLIGMSVNVGNHFTVGTACSIIVQMLAVGLYTGSAHAFEEVSEMRGATETPFVWGNDELSANTQAVVKVFGFFGLRAKFTAVEFSVWMSSILVLTGLQVWHNVYGKEIPSIKSCFTRTAINSNEIDMIEDNEVAYSKESI